MTGLAIASLLSGIAVIIVTIREPFETAIGAAMIAMIAVAIIGSWIGFPLLD